MEYVLFLWIEGYYITVMAGSLDDCKQYASSFCKWNQYYSHLSFLLRDSRELNYFFTEHYELITGDSFGYEI